MKRFMVVALALILTILSAMGLAACVRDDGDAVKAVSAFVSSYPKQYYAVGEAFSLSGGEITVVYSNGTQKTLSMLDEAVTVGNYSGTGVAGRLTTVNLDTEGVRATFRYYVSAANAVIDEVLFEDGELAPLTKYAVSEIRTKPTFNDLKLTINYRDDMQATRSYVLDRINFDNYSVSLSGFDVTEVGNGQLTVSYLATDYTAAYEVVDDDWVDSAEFFNYSGTGYFPLAQNYFLGDSFNAGDSVVVNSYNSGKSERLAVTAEMCEGFDTSTTGAKTMRLKLADGSIEEIDYTVHDPALLSEVQSLRVRSVLANYQGILSVNDKLTLAELLEDCLLEVVMQNGGYVSLTAADSKISVTCSFDDYVDIPLTAEVFAQIKEKGRNYSLKFTYLNSVSPESDTQLSVMKEWIETIITGWSTVKTQYATGEDFDFGEARLTKIFDDGTEESFGLQEEYLKAVRDRGININNLRAVQAASFDMTAGSHDNAYYVAVTLKDGFITVDGQSTEASGGRLYVSYSVA